MKFKVILATLLILAGIAFVSGAPSEKISILEAKNSAMQFLDNHTPRMEYRNNFSTQSGDYYIFASDRNRQYVNTRTGHVERADFPDSFMTRTSRISISQEKAMGIATAYAIAHYPNFTEKGMRLADATLLDHGITKEYQFVWRQVIGDVISPNFVLVQINPETGNINSYIGINREIEVSLTPVISRDDAVAIASKSFPSQNPAEITTEVGIGYPEKDTQKLLWVVKIQRKTGDNIVQDGTAVIDAQTGQVYSRTI
jgi:hypothetical protein